jgi:hypothetical protein
MSIEKENSFQGQQNNPSAAARQTQTSDGSAIEGKQAHSLPEWICKTQNTSKITVGTVMVSDCETSELLTNEIANKVQGFVLPDGQTYAVKLLGLTVQGPHQVQLKWTSYQTGRHDLSKGLVLKVDSVPIVIKGIQVEVESVLKPEMSAEGQGRQAYPPFGPFVSPLPMWIVVSVVGLVVISIVFAVLKMRRGWQRRRLIKELSQSDKAERPSVEFYRRIRLLNKTNPVFNSSQASLNDFKNCVVELQDAYLEFVTRRFFLPAKRWDQSTLIREMKKYFPQWHTRDRGQFEKNLRILQMLSNEDKMDMRDIQSLLKSLGQWVDEADSFLNKESSHEMG